MERIVSLRNNEDLMREVCTINEIIFEKEGTLDNCFTFNFEEEDVEIYNPFLSVCTMENFDIEDSIEVYGDSLLNSKFNDREQLIRFIRKNKDLLSNVIRGIEVETIIENFKEDTNSLEYAREYGINEVIDGHLYCTYEGTFTEEEVESIMSILSKEFNL